MFMWASNRYFHVDFVTTPLVTNPICPHTVKEKFLVFVTYFLKRASVSERQHTGEKPHACEFCQYR